MKTIVYELNEVPRRLIEFYGEAFPSSAFATLLTSAKAYQTKTADIGHLSPWVTWPTMHRGVANVDHKISELGQDLSKVNQDFPPIWELLAGHGLSVGVFGSLQSYPLPKNIENYQFYLPDTFAASDRAYPSSLSDFQRFNLAMVRANGRNVNSGIAVNSGLKFMLGAGHAGLRASTVRSLAKQLINEVVNRDRVVRRRTSQIEIAFDLFLHQLRSDIPDVSFFFTNHVASSMHRYWPTIFPEDYDEGKFDKDWLQRWVGEIPHAVSVANAQLRTLIELCDRKNVRLIVASSMGQSAVPDTDPTTHQVLITDIALLLEFIGIERDMWEPRLSMAPRVVVRPNADSFKKKLSALDGLLINGKRVNFVESSSGDIRFDIWLPNQKSITAQYDGESVDPRKLGVSNIHLQDASGSYAYHIPEGILFDYMPHRVSEACSDGEWTEVSSLDFAPSLLRSFGFSANGYMTGDRMLFVNSSG